MVKQPTSCSWAWKRILHLRTEFRRSFRWSIGDGRSVSLWFDNWHPRGPLNFLFSDSLIYTSGLPRLASMEDLFSPAGQSIRAVLESWEQPLPFLSQVPDRFTWVGSTSGLFSVASAWHLIRTKKPRVKWASLIWNNTITLRYQFNLWLITKNRLPTQALLLSYELQPVVHFFGRLDATFLGVIAIGPTTFAGL